MNYGKYTLTRALGLSLSSLWSAGPPWLLLACKDDSPCDEGQQLYNGECYVVDGASTDGTPEAIDAEFGQPCMDTAASSDCGGQAPFCAPLPSGAVCTQVLCLEGEPNAGACPSDWPCNKIGTYPSACLNL